jgi:dihydropteroate synthase
MGVLNVTPDSFSDGGRWTDHRDAIETGVRMARQGADIVDVGGESTRPGAGPVAPDLEQERVIPVIRALSSQGITVSVDTRNGGTMRAALGAGARIVNDVSGLSQDPLAVRVVVEHACAVVLMHMRGTPATMNAQAIYRDVVAEVRTELADRIERAVSAGVRPDRIAIDPGIGFAKRAEHSQAILRGLPRLVELGYPVLVGASRKSFLGALSRETRADHRLGASLAAGLFALLQGASILRVHDVPESVQALNVWQTLFE